MLFNAAKVKRFARRGANLSLALLASLSQNYQDKNFTELVPELKGGDKLEFYS